MKAQISALMDGELEQQESMLLVAQIKREETARECWSNYHVIGDSLRGHGSVSPDFMHKFSARLSAEPTVLAPRSRPAPISRSNWLPLSAAASIAGMLVVAWMALPIVKQSQQPAQISQSRSANLASTLVRDVPRREVTQGMAEASVNDYVSAHREFAANGDIHSGMTVIRMNDPVLPTPAKAENKAAAAKEVTRP